jgi:hypothetical protein
VEQLLTLLERLAQQTPEQIAAEVMTRRPVADRPRSLSSVASLEAQGEPKLLGTLLLDTLMTSEVPCDSSQLAPQSLSA